MKLETRFDIGQEVWALNWQPYTDPRKTWGVSAPGVVEDIEVTVRCGVVVILYQIGLGLRRNENRLFPTRAEAEAECLKRNGGGK